MANGNGRTPSPQSTEALNLYLTLGPTRSIEKVGEMLGKSRQLLERWSVRDGWVAKAADFDNHLVASKIKAFTKVIEAEGEAEARLGLKMIKVAERSMDAYLHDDPLMIRPRDAAALADTGVRIKRLTEGKTTEISEQPVINVLIIENRDDNYKADRRIQEILSGKQG